MKGWVLRMLKHLRRRRKAPAEPDALDSCQAMSRQEDRRNAEERMSEHDRRIKPLRMRAELMRRHSGDT